MYPRCLWGSGGSVTDAVAVAHAPDGGDLATCIAEVSRGLSFRPPDFGPWQVEVRFRVGVP
jgi:hypothetical protein